MTKLDSSPAWPIILALDTSSKATSIAVARGAELLGSINHLSDQNRSESLWTEVNALLVGIGIAINDVDVFSVCVGPGGFTGLRVGMAAVMGFSAATGKPLVGVTSLEAAAFSAGPAAVVCAVVNAYKGEVYSQLFSFDDEGVPVAENDPMVSSLAKALDRVHDKNDVIFAGDGAAAGAAEIESVSASLGENIWKTRRLESGLAETIARLAFLKYSRGVTETASTLKASYVRPSEAEIKLSLGLLGSKIKRSMKRE